MYQLLALGTGILTCVMVSVNGSLTDQYGVFPATMIIHVVGSVFALILCALQKEKKKLLGHRPRWIYLGGAIGVFTTVFQSMAYGYISMTSIVALGLLGQTVTSLFIDCLGLFGMEKRPFQKTSLPGLIFAALGIFLMMDTTVTTAFVAVCVSLCSGLSIVLSRTVNARLAAQTGALRGSLLNHLVGLPITVVLAFALSQGHPLAGASVQTFRPWIYLGGTMGVALVLLYNIIVPQVSAFRLTTLSFVGQIFTGILLDVAMGGSYSKSSFYGGLVIAAGIAVNMILEQAASRKSAR